MMEGRPIKFRLLEIINEGEIWSHEAIKKIQSEYASMGPANHFRDMINFDLMELATSGFIVTVDSKIDVDGVFRQDALLTKYKMSQIGKNQYQSLVDHPLKKRKGGK
jgi:hypothetical protein